MYHDDSLCHSLNHGSWDFQSFRKDICYFFLSVRSKEVDANPSTLNRSTDLKQMGWRHISTVVARIFSEKSHLWRSPLDALENLRLFIGSSVNVGYPLLFPWEKPGFQEGNNYITVPSPNLNNTQSYGLTTFNWIFHWVLWKGIEIKQDIYLGGLCWVGRIW